jgi:hypothetical protein
MSSILALSDFCDVAIRVGRTYLFWQLCLQVCDWLSQALRQGVLNVVGQTRLQDAFSFAQLAKHASEAAFANRTLLLSRALVPATAVPTSANKKAVPTANFIENLR